MFRIVANNIDPAVTADYFALITHDFDTRPDFHNYLTLYVILPFVESYGVTSTFTLSPGMMRIKLSRILPDKWQRII